MHFCTQGLCNTHCHAIDRILKNHLPYQLTVGKLISGGTKNGTV